MEELQIDIEAMLLGCIRKDKAEQIASKIVQKIDSHYEKGILDKARVTLIPRIMAMTEKQYNDMGFYKKDV